MLHASLTQFFVSEGVPYWFCLGYYHCYLCLIGSSSECSIVIQRQGQYIKPTLELHFLWQPDCTDRSSAKVYFCPSVIIKKQNTCSISYDIHTTLEMKQSNKGMGQHWEGGQHIKCAFKTKFDPHLQDSFAENHS